MRLRLALAPVLALSIAGIVALPSSGQSAAPTCPLITDEQGDADAPPVISNGLVKLLSSNNPAYDVTSADLASDGHILTLVIRVAQLSTSANLSPTGIFWRFDFTPPQGSPLFAEVVSDTNSSIGGPAGVTAYLGYVDGTAHLIKYVTPTLDLAKNEVRVRVRLSDFGDHRPATGSELTALQASGGRWYDLPGFTLGETDDTATTNDNVILGRKTCIRV